jgi:hypothetical protein
MAITVTAPAVGTFGFFVNGVSADASAVEELLAGVAGKSIYIDHLSIASDSAISISIGEGETVPGTIDTILLGPIPFAINQQIQWNFQNGGMRLAAAKSLVVDTSGAGNINVFASVRIQ